MSKLVSKQCVDFVKSFEGFSATPYYDEVGGLLGSTLYKNICKGIRDVDTITANFIAWSRAGGQQLAGLLRRRQQEAAMFFGTGNQVNETNPIDVLLENVKDPNRVQLIKALQ